MDLGTVTSETFEPLLGQRFSTQLAEEPLQLELRKVQRMQPEAGPDGARSPFSLIFVGPAQPLLPQRIYPLEHPDLGSFEIFLVPIGLADGELRYQAVFA